MRKAVSHNEHTAHYGQYVAETKDGKFTIQGTDLVDGRLTKCYEIIQGLPSGKLLDIGGCNGFFSRLLKHDSVVFDICKAQVIKAKKGCIGSSEFMLPFKDNSFDYIYAGEVIEHVIDTDFFLEECNRVLKKGGTCVISTPNLASIGNIFLLLFGKQPKWVDYKCDKASHVRAYAPEAFISHLKEHGFEIKQVNGSWIQPLKLLKGAGIRLGTIFPKFAAHLIVVCQK